MDIRDFTSDEIAEINSYVITQIPQSILPQLFLLTEEPIKKVKAFIAIYRIINSCRDFIGNKDTQNKLDEFLSYSKNTYKELYTEFLSFEKSTLERENDFYLNKIIKIVIRDNEIISYLTNTFLVFAEKIELLSTETVSGIKLDKPEGEELYNKLITKVEM